MADAVAPRDWRKRRGGIRETHRETKLELPPGLQSILQTLADEIDGLQAADKATREEIAALKSALVEACSHLRDAA